MDATKKTLEQFVDDFAAHIGNAISSIEHAAKNYAEAVRAFGEKAQEAFEQRYPHVTPNTWAKFMAVGNGDLNQSALLLSDQFCAKIARMPRAKQDDVLNGDSFEVFNPTTREVERVNYGMIKPRQERLLFDETRNCVRTAAEQMAYSDMMAKEKRFSHRPYTVFTDRLEVHTACTIGRRELEGILEEM